uniref:Uncharacterized protein n=1 Tax=Arundo donax TaxID=35708 RepID=A0A0A8Z2B7_ARUDO
MKLFEGHIKSRSLYYTSQIMRGVNHHINLKHNYEQEPRSSSRCRTMPLDNKVRAGCRGLSIDSRVVVRCSKKPLQEFEPPSNPGSAQGREVIDKPLRPATTPGRTDRTRINARNRSEEKNNWRQHNNSSSSKKHLRDEGG